METKKFQVANAFDFQSFCESLQVLNGSINTSIEEMSGYTLIVSEKYFIRNNSAASATLLFVKNEYGYECIMVVSGAGGGILNLDYGASKKYMQDVTELLEKLGAQER